jgi:hypothetical protein
VALDCLAYLVWKVCQDQKEIKVILAFLDLLDHPALLVFLVYLDLKVNRAHAALLEWVFPVFLAKTADLALTAVPDVKENKVYLG